jgi:hypothetical protein
MAITACPVTPTFAAEIGDVDLSRQINPTDLAAIEDAFTKYAVLISNSCEQEGITIGAA